MWSAIQRRRLGSPLAAAVGMVAVVTALGAGISRAQSPVSTASSEVLETPPAPASARAANPFADHFPNVVLKTHEGRNVRFYDDLLKDKIVLINFMYATCTER